jgi:4-amino-4-deoxy-L-arabinose transferase-like glycosyltransferase
MTDGSSGRRWSLLAVLLAAGVVAAIYLEGQGRGFANSDEVVYAEFIRAMHRSGDYGTLRFQGTDLLQRPATSVALYAAVARFVPGELGMRLVPTLLTLAVLFGVAGLVWHHGGRLAAALATLLAFAAIPSELVYGRVILSDQPFVLACTLALGATMAAQRQLRWLPVAGLGLGAAFAVKSLAAGIPALALAPWLLRSLWLQRRAPAARRQLLLAVLAFTGTAAPFYLLGLWRHGARFWDEHVVQNLLLRASGRLEAIIGIGGPLAYVQHIWRADGAAVAVLLGAGTAAAGVLAWRRRDHALGVAATYAAVVFLLLSAMGTRLANYLLVFYPGAVLAAGLALARAMRVPRVAAWARWLAPAAALAGLAASVATPPFDDVAYPSVESRALGEVATQVAAPEERIYTIDWYAPALGYYADRTWHSLVTIPRMAAALGNTDPFRYTRTVHAVPPWPPGRLLVAAPEMVLRTTDGFVVERVLARSGEYLLVTGRGR